MGVFCGFLWGHVLGGVYFGGVFQCVPNLGSVLGPVLGVCFGGPFWGSRNRGSVERPE